MGYGEYGGGGSVEWRIVHGDKKQKGKDKDPQPVKGTGGQFKVYVDGLLVGSAAVDTGTVLVVWDPDTFDTATADLAEKKKTDPRTGA